jgi:hypothetical protein
LTRTTAVRAIAVVASREPTADAAIDDAATRSRAGARELSWKSRRDLRSRRRKRTTRNPEVTPVATPKTKLKLKVDFDGRQHPFHPNSDETAGALKGEAVTFFQFVGDPNTLGLFRADNSMLDDGTPLESYHLAHDEVLVMRQRNVGGGEA